MSGTAKKTDETLWDKVKARVTKGDKGGKPGQWSARKVQLAVGEYKTAGGGYEGRRDDDNHLRQWTDETWGTKSGRPSGETGERYLPERARDHISDADYGRTTAKKRSDGRKGRQFSPQPADVARKTRPFRATGKGAGTGAPSRPTKADLYARAKARDLPGRSRTSRDELETALA